MNADFYCEKLKPLFGATVTGIARDFDNEFFGLEFKLADGSTKTLWILQDDEGNGPGSFDIEDA